MSVHDEFALSSDTRGSVVRSSEKQQTRSGGVRFLNFDLLPCLYKHELLSAYMIIMPYSSEFEGGIGAAQLVSFCERGMSLSYVLSRRTHSTLTLLR